MFRLKNPNVLLVFEMTLLICGSHPRSSDSSTQGRIQDFKLGGAVKIISCEKSRFYAKNHDFTQKINSPPPPGSAPVTPR